MNVKKQLFFLYSFSRKRHRIFFFPLFFLLLSCTGKQQAGSEASVADSLSTRCYHLLMQLQTDSLRSTAQLYMESVSLNSRAYFKARQYYINSYFNAQNYDEVLTLLDATQQMEHFNDYVSIVCDYQYTRARVYQYTSRYSEAIETFKKCLNFSPSDSRLQEEMLPTILSAMTQLMNVYRFSDQVEEGYIYYRKLKEHPTSLIRNFMLRDLYSHLGYLAMLSGRISEAYRITDSVFVLSLHNPTPEKLFRDYSYASVVFYTNLDTKERVIKWLEQAIEEAAKYQYTTGLEWSMDMLGNLYREQNRIEESLQLEYKALASARKRNDKGAQSYVYMTLSALYKNWELYEQADDYANRSIEMALPTNNNLLKGGAFQMKARVLTAIGQPDSAIYYYKKSKLYLEKAENAFEVCKIKGQIAELMIDFHSNDSLALGIQLLRETIGKTGDKYPKSYYFYCLAKGLIKQGKTAEGEVALDSMYADASRIKDVVYSDGVLEYVIDYYLSKKDNAKVAQYTSFYRKQVGTRYDEKISRKVASSMIQYRTEEKEQKLKLANAQLAIKDLRIQLYIVALILLFLVIIGGIFWYIRERKLQKSRRLLAEQEKLIVQRECELIESRLREQDIQLTNALENLQDANVQSEQMREQLDEFMSDCQKQQSIVSMTPTIFREKGEVKFRRYFAQLYPAYLNLLQERIPDITRGEEILCMLIVLKQNMDEVADILCIEKKSVKMSRYRLRKKIGIDQDESLDDFIRSLL